MHILFQKYLQTVQYNGDLINKDVHQLNQKNLHMYIVSNKYQQSFDIIHPINEN